MLSGDNIAMCRRISTGSADPHSPPCSRRNSLRHHKIDGDVQVHGHARTHRLYGLRIWKIVTAKLERWLMLNPQANIDSQTGQCVHSDGRFCTTHVVYTNLALPPQWNTKWLWSFGLRHTLHTSCVSSAPLVCFLFTRIRPAAVRVQSGRLQCGSQILSTTTHQQLRQKSFRAHSESLTLAGGRGHWELEVGLNNEM